MIFIREKVELFGISWLNYASLSLIIGLIALACAIYCYLRSRDDVYFSEIFAWIFCILAFCSVMGHYASYDKGHSDKKLPLSAIDNKITVNGEKVAIDKLDENFGYLDSDIDSSKRNLFKFDYDEIYETGKLIDEYSQEYKLSKEDIDYLRSKQAKGEK